MKTWKIVLTLVVVFMLGMIAGGLITTKLIRKSVQNFITGSPEVGDRIVKQMTRELRLDPEQKKKLSVIVENGLGEMRAVREEALPKIGDIIYRSENDIRDILNPEQLKKFERMTAKRRESWEKMKR